MSVQKEVAVFSPEAFRGKVVGITGGSRGIGEAAVRLLAGLGAHVICIARDPDDLHRLNEECRAGKLPVSCHAADVSDGETMLNIIRSAGEKFGHIDGWVNNAMMNPAGLMEEQNEEQFTKAWEVNTLAAWRCAKACLPYMKTSGGSIVNVSSVVAWQTVPTQAAYTSSKSALEGLTRALAVELAPQRIRVNTLSPGFIRTYTGSSHLRNHESQLSEKERLEKALIDVLTEQGQPWPTHGRAEDMANIIAFLLSPASTFLTGTCIMADGGLTVWLRAVYEEPIINAGRKIAEIQKRLAQIAPK